MSNTRLRIITHGQNSPDYNMAVDEALLHHIQDPVLRIYAWDCPAISIGYFQSAQIVPDGRPFVRRYTGGGLVDHAFDLTYTLVIPRTHPIGQSGTSQTYCTIHRAISSALTESGIDNALTPVTLDGDPTACFAKPVAHDIIHPPTGSKLAGAAQRRNRLGILHQGSILSPEKKQHPPQPLAQLLIRHISQTLDLTPTQDTLTQEELSTSQNLRDTRYSTPDWNYQK